MNWARRLLNLFRSKQVDADIEDEFNGHIAESTKNLIASGMTEEEAQRQARRQFGNYALHKEKARDMVLLVFIGEFFRDARYGARQLRRNPGFTLVAVLALAVGVGANITIFGFVSALVFRPLDVQEPSQLVRVLGEGGNTERALATNSEAHIRLRDYVEYRDRTQAFSNLAAQSIGGPVPVRTTGPPEIIPVMPVSANYFSTLGIPAAMGRILTSEDDDFGAAGVIVLSDAGWHRFFGADLDVIGKTAFVNGIPKTIVGITPVWFKGTTSPMVPQIYTPIGNGWNPPRVDLIGRLKPGVSASLARADLLRISAQLTIQDRERRSIEIYAAKVLMPVLLRSFSLFAAVFMIIVGVVLMIVCDNIAILILARSAGRQKEIGVRLALGASRARLIPQLLMESMLLCAVGGLLGLYIAYATANFLTQIYLPVPMPFALTFDLDWRVICFAIFVSFATTLLCGLAPALQSLRTDVLSSLNGAILTGSRVRSGLMISQIALSLMLLVSAAALIRSLMMPSDNTRGFVSEGVLMATINVAGPGYTFEKRLAFLETLLRRLEDAPGVLSVTIVDNIPLGNNNPVTPIVLRGADRSELVQINRISQGLFRTLNIPLLAGRDFASSDTANSHAVGIINETLARHFWPGEDPIGKQVQNPDGSVVEVIGLARDSKYESVDEQPKSFLYLPMTQAAVTLPTFLVKASGSPATVLSFIKARVAEMDPELVPYNLITLEERLGLSMLINRAIATVSGSLGLLALFLGSIGIYGTMSFLVEQRRREIGIRIALGASRRNVMNLITKQGIAWTVSGVAIGLLGGLACTLLLQRFLYGVTVADPVVLIVTPLILGASAYLACYIPARRANRVTAMDLLRDSRT